MAIENGQWIMRGLRWDDPFRIRSWQDLICWIDEIGFLPLFKNEIDGFSAEEHTSDLYWWSGDPEQDPWEWRELIARSGQVAYGKFFGKKVYKTMIPRNVRLSEAPSHRKPAIAYDKESKGARAYLHLAGELIKREEKAAKAAQEAAAAATAVKHG